MAESWKQLVNRLFQENKKKGVPSAYKQAMIDAKKVYRSSSAAPASVPATKKRRGSKRARKTRKA